MTSNVIERYHIIPAGMYQPGSKTQALRDADIKTAYCGKWLRNYMVLESTHSSFERVFISHYTDTDEATLKSEGECLVFPQVSNKQSPI